MAGQVDAACAQVPWGGRGQHHTLLRGRLSGHLSSVRGHSTTSLMWVGLGTTKCMPWARTSGTARHLRATYAQSSLSIVLGWLMVCAPCSASIRPSMRGTGPPTRRIDGCVSNVDGWEHAHACRGWWCVAAVSSAHAPCAPWAQSSPHPRSARCAPWASPSAQQTRGAMVSRGP